MRAALSQSSASPLPFRVVIVSLLLAFGLSSATLAQVATTTALSIPTPSVAVGVPTLLTATVTDASSRTVLLGTVTFYDGSRALGSAQIVSHGEGAYAQGTANLKTESFSVGANSITAVFASTTSDLTSTSSAKTVTATGKNRTATVLSSTGVAGDYTLTAALQAFGVGVPTGNIDFLDTTVDTSLGTAPLSGATWMTGFGIGSTPAAASSPSGAIAGDFNGDGFQDLAIATNQGGTSVLIGNGDGTFKPQVIYGAGIFPTGIYTGDFNNDGKLDLAVANDDDGAIGILLGNGDGTFQSQIEYGSVSSAIDACIGDFNRDGNLDIALSGLGSDEVAVLLGNGNGTFQPQQTYATGSGPWTVRAGDLNGDGFLDLVVSAGGGVSVLLGKGDGTFGPQQMYSVGNGPFLALADLEGNGTLDVVVSNSNESTVTVAMGKGDGSFLAPTTYSLLGNPGQPVVADFNEDGKLDIAVAINDFSNAANNTIEVLLGNGNGTFQPAVVYAPELITPYYMVQGDFNGDGRPDLAEVTSLVNVATVLLNQQTASLQLADVSLPGTGTAQVTANYSGDSTFAPSMSNLLDLDTGTPEITSLSANYGALYANLELTGTGFGATQGSSTVTFNGIVAPVSSWSNASITVTVPYRATTGNILVTVKGETSNSVPFTVEPTPTVTGISPTDGAAGTLVTITGTNLLDAQGQGEVWLYELPVPIVSQSSTSLQVRIPAGAISGVMNVHINGVGLATPVFTVAGSPAQPHVTSLSANYGAPYAVLTLTGSGFGAVQGSSTVTFNGVVAPTVWGNSSMLVAVPYRATSGNVVVTVAGQASNGIAFTVEPSPSVTGTSPSSGPPGTTVTISGQNLVDAEGHGAVYFDGISLPILSPSNTSIQVVTPAGATTGVFDVHINGVGVYTPTFTVN